MPLQPPTINESDLQAPKALWHEDTRGRPGGGYQRPLGSNGQQHYANGQPVGPLAPGAFRMLNHNLPGNRSQYPQPQVGLPWPLHA